MMPDQDVHAGQPVRRYGPRPSGARLTVILVHGRGDSADGILHLARELDVPDVAFLAPQAARHTWYPSSFLAPFEQNEPALSSAFGVLAEQVGTAGRQGIAPERLVLMGFSQGACLSLEFAARHARRYAAVVALSGGLIGPPGTPRSYDGAFDGTPVFLGCSDIDPHIPLDRVRESADVFRRLDAAVDERIYPGLDHTVNEDEIRAVRALLAQTAAGGGL
jgi:predicted esterase